MQKSCQKSPSEHHRTTLSGYIFAIKARIDNRKNMLSSSISSTCPHNMMNFGPVAVIGPVVWGTPANFIIIIIIYLPQKFMIYKTLDNRSSMTGQQGIQMRQQLSVNKCTCKVALENSTHINIISYMLYFSRLSDLLSDYCS